MLNAEKDMEAKKLNQNNFEENASAKLAVLGSAIATIGDAISTIAAVMALDEAILADAKQQQEQKEQEQKFQMLQNQIDDLTKKLKEK